MNTQIVYDVEIPTCREGIFVPVPFTGPEGITQTVTYAESLGYGAVWATDFVNPVPSFAVPEQDPPNWYEPIVALAAMVGQTTRIKLGTGVVMLPFRDPVILAKQVATLDQFSGGRLLLGLGLGSRRDELLSVHPRMRKVHRGHFTNELMEVLHLLLNAEDRPVHYEGKYVEFDGVRLHPRPRQTPLPFYLPGRVDAGLERIARWGHGHMVPASAAREHVEAIRPFLERHERSMDEIDVVAEAELCIAETRELAAERYRSSRMGRARLELKGLTLQEMVENHWIGTVDDVVAKMNRVIADGVTHFNVLHIAADTLEDRLEQMRLFAEQVIPKLG